MSALVLIDQSSLMHKAFYAYENMQHRGVNTGILYGYLLALREYKKWIVNNYGSAIEIVVCKDMKPYTRSRIYPGYKSNRTVDKDKSNLFRVSSKQINEFNIIAGIPQIGVVGLEADDLIAIFAKKYNYKYKFILVVSPDSDMFQLLDIINLVLIRGDHKQPKKYTLSNFKSDYPSMECALDWHKIGAITGGHNGLPGIAGIGIARALAYLSGTIKGKAKETIDNNIKSVSGHYRLSLLPLPCFDLVNTLSIPSIVERSDLFVLDEFAIKYGLSDVFLNSIVK